MDVLRKFAERGYVVKENGTVYFTMDMDKTIKWFEEVLGWYYEIDERNAEGKGTYGCVYDLPREFENIHIAPLRGNKSHTHPVLTAPRGGELNPK